MRRPINRKDIHGIDIHEGDYNQDFDVVLWCDNRMGWSLNAYDMPSRSKVFCHCHECEGHFEIHEVMDKFEVKGNIWEAKS